MQRSRAALSNPQSKIPLPLRARRTIVSLRPPMDEEQFATLRQNMIMEITAITVMVAERIGKYNLDARVMQVMGSVARHEFVPLEIQPYAYLDRPLPIGFDKTISQPFIVALMTDLLQVGSQDVVLEIG